MKSKVLIGLVVALTFLGVCSVSAQSGYKDYTWGMTVEQVKKKCPTLKYDEHTYYFNTPRFAFYYLYRNEIKPDDRPDPLSHEEREITAYYPVYAYDPGSACIDEFYFVGGKLVAIELTFAEENILKDLEAQYGKAQPIRHVEGVRIWDAVAWCDSKRRYIVWVTNNYALEYVTYIDGIWLTPLLNKEIAGYRQEREEAKSVLDF